MKKILVTILISLVTYISYGQHSYLATFDKDSIKLITESFKEMGATECIYSEHNHYFKVKTKNLLPRIIAEDYFSAIGLKLTLYLEVDEKPQLFRMPVKKDTLRAD